MLVVFQQKTILKLGLIVSSNPIFLQAWKICLSAQCSQNKISMIMFNANQWKWINLPKFLTQFQAVSFPWSQANMLQNGRETKNYYVGWVGSWGRTSKGFGQQSDMTKVYCIKFSKNKSKPEKNPQDKMLNYSICIFCIIKKRILMIYINCHCLKIALM